MNDRDRIARHRRDLVVQRLFGGVMALQGTTRAIDSPDVEARVARTIDDPGTTIS
ncbi:hypothetical protein [Amycolatopsis sp. NPDC004625]|uniref:hypothetical protein n=1 Tax=Amycolatopsis sp. NPDC004625 TaxID=3154670 RepID=UPI0033A6A786